MRPRLPRRSSTARCRARSRSHQQRREDRTGPQREVPDHPYLRGSVSYGLTYHRLGRADELVTSVRQGLNEGTTSPTMSELADLRCLAKRPPTYSRAVVQEAHEPRLHRQGCRSPGPAAAASLCLRPSSASLSASEISLNSKKERASASWRGSHLFAMLGYCQPHWPACRRPHLQLWSRPAKVRPGAGGCLVRTGRPPLKSIVSCAPLANVAAMGTSTPSRTSYKQGRALTNTGPTAQMGHHSLSPSDAGEARQTPRRDREDQAGIAARERCNL